MAVIIPSLYNIFPPASFPSPPASPSVVEAYESLKEEVTCPICYDNLKNAFETVCCHTLICSSCKAATEASCCPFCRSGRYSCRPNVPIRKLLEKVDTFLGVYSPSPAQYEEENRKKRETEERKKEENRRKELEERRKREEEERRKREDKQKAREEEERRMWEEGELMRLMQEIKQESREERLRDLRGTQEMSWVPDQVSQDFDSMVDSSEVQRICFFRGSGFLFHNTNGFCGWSGLPHGRLKSLLMGRGRDMTNQVRVISVTETQSGHLYYYVEFMDGKAYWDPYLPRSVCEFFAAAHSGVGYVALGVAEDGEEVQYVICARGLVLSHVAGLHSSWLDDFAFVSLGLQGEFCVRDGDNFCYSYLPLGQFQVVKGLENERRLRRLYFGPNQALMAFYV